MPLGTPLRKFVYDVGGAPNGRTVKAVQTGGPSGGCIPQEMFDTPVDYESLAQLGPITGSGGMVVMDEDNCMVDVARYFVEFTHSESCGKCIPCRAGLDKSLHYLSRLTHGKGTEEDLEILDELSRMIRDASLCGLGQTAPNPVLTTMRHFRHEFEDHIRARRCRAGVCEELAISPCENSCPLHMNIPRCLQLLKEDRLEEAFLSVVLDNPLPASTGRVCQHPCDNRCRRAGLDEAVNMRDVHRYIADSIYPTPRFDELAARVAALRKRPHGPPLRRRRRRAHGPRLRLIPRAARPRSDGVRFQSRRRRHAALRPARLPPAEGRARPRDRTHPPRRRPVHLQHARAGARHAERPRRAVRRRVPRHRHLEKELGLSAGHGAQRRHAGAAVPGSGGQARRDADRPPRGRHRRRQRGHRLGAHRAAHGLRGDHRLPPRAEGHARNP